MRGLSRRNMVVELNALGIKSPAGGVWHCTQLGRGSSSSPLAITNVRGLAPIQFSLDSRRWEKYISRVKQIVAIAKKSLSRQSPMKYIFMKN